MMMLTMTNDVQQPWLSFDWLKGKSTGNPGNSRQLKGVLIGFPMIFGRLTMANHGDLGHPPESSSLEARAVCSVHQEDDAIHLREKNQVIRIPAWVKEPSKFTRISSVTRVSHTEASSENSSWSSSTNRDTAVLLVQLSRQQLVALNLFILA